MMRKWLEMPEKHEKGASRSHSVTRIAPTDQLAGLSVGKLVLVDDVPAMKQRRSVTPRKRRFTVRTGYYIDSFMPSDEYWFMRLIPDVDLEHADAVYEPLLVAADPETGKLIGKFPIQFEKGDPTQPNQVHATSIACLYNGEFLAFRRDGQGRVVAMRAQLPP